MRLLWQTVWGQAYQKAVVNCCYFCCWSGRPANARALLPTFCCKSSPVSIGRLILWFYTLPPLCLFLSSSRRSSDMAADDKSSSSSSTLDWVPEPPPSPVPTSPSHLTHFKPLSPEQEEPPLRSAYSSFVSLFRFSKGEWDWWLENRCTAMYTACRNTAFFLFKMILTITFALVTVVKLSLPHRLSSLNGLMYERVSYTFSKGVIWIDLWHQSNCMVTVI